MYGGQVLLGMWLGTLQCDTVPLAQFSRRVLVHALGPFEWVIE